jgi:hypothetical protein
MRPVLLRARYVVLSCIVGMLVLAGVAALGGCGSSDYTTTTGAYGGDESGYTATTAASASTTASPMTTVAQAGSSKASSSSSGSAQPNVATLTGESGQKIIGDAVLDIEVAKGGFQIAFNNAALLSDRYGGYIVASESSATGENGKVNGGTVAVRVPAASFSAAVADAAKLGTLKNQQIKTQDVTEEYVDLQARIINSQAKLDTFRKLFDKATSINDIVNVQQVVTAAQDELEQLKGRQRYLQEHTSYSTLTMNIREAGVEAVTTTSTSLPPWGTRKAFGDAAHNFVKAVNAIVRALGVIIPVLVILAIIAFIAWRWWRWSARKHAREMEQYRLSAVAAAAAAPTASTAPAAAPEPPATPAKPRSDD